MQPAKKTTKYTCIENRMNNGNFTLGMVYEVSNSGSRITCDFIQLSLPKGLVRVNTTEFEFAFCKFKAHS